jgi:hypothetical protein
MRCSLRYFADGSPVTVGYPFATVAFANGYIEVRTHRKTGRFRVPISSITKAERTRHGVRVHTSTAERRFIMSSYPPSRIVSLLRQAGIEVEATVTRSRRSDV